MSTLPTGIPGTLPTGILGTLPTGIQVMGGEGASLSSPAIDALRWLTGVAASGSNTGRHKNGLASRLGVPHRV